MLSSVLYFLPCLVSLLWFFSFLLKEKTERQSLFTWILLTYTFYFATYAIYISPHTDYHTMVMMDVFCVPLIPVMVALLLVYIHTLRKRSRITLTFIVVLLIPAFVVGTITSLLYYLIGFENTARIIELTDKGLPIPAEYQTEIFRTYNFFTEPFVNFCAIVFEILIIIECIAIERNGGYQPGDVFRFFFKGKSSTPARIIAILQLTFLLLMCPITLLGRRFMFNHETLAIILTLLVAVIVNLLAYVEFYSNQFRHLTLHDLSHLRLGLEEVTESPKNKDHEEDLSEGDKERASMSRRKAEAAELMHKLLEVDKIYTDENLSSASMAEMLGIGRTTFSSMMISTYGITFRELLNKYRIEHAKQYMLKNPSATQEVIAIECGFKNAQYLNFRFKETVGETPSIWLKKQLEEGARQKDEV